MPARTFARLPSTTRLAAHALALAALTLSSGTAVAIGPVPLTMQTLVVTMAGVLLGARQGAAVVAFWVALGFSGAPFFAFGNAGPAALLGPTAGYLLSFPLVAYAAGVLACRGGLLRIFAAMLAANFFCLIFGSAWLSVTLGVPQAFAAGFLPFVAGAVLKSVLGTLLIGAMGGRR